MNTLRERPDSLAEMDHCVLLDQLLRVLEAGAVPFFCQEAGADGRLVLNADGVARAVAARQWNERDLVTRPERGRPSACTLNMPVEQVERMRHRLHAIELHLRKQWDEAAADETAELVARRFMGPAGSTSPFGKLAWLKGGRR